MARRPLEMRLYSEGLRMQSRNHESHRRPKARRWPSPWRLLSGCRLLRPGEA